MKLGLAGKVALVTGGNAGIGRATALAFASEGVHVAVAARREAEGKETVATIEKEGGKAIFIQTDVTKEDDVDRMVEFVVNKFGHLDYAFNNAGIVNRIPLIEMSKDDFKSIINVNLTGVFLCMKYEIIQMLKQGKGAIVNMSSALGIAGTHRPLSAYVASKHGVIGLTKAAALAYAKSGIRINSISPGAILTEMQKTAIASDPSVEKLYIDDTPIGRYGTPEEVANTVVWLCSDAASFVHGENMRVDGGARSK